MQGYKYSFATAWVLAAVLLAPQAGIAQKMGDASGWDVFGARDGTMVSIQGYMGTSMSPAPGQGFDAFQSREGTLSPLPASYQGTAMEPAGQGWDAFHSRAGQPL